MARELWKVDGEQRLYVLREGNGYSCLGFDVALRKGRAVAQWADVEGPDESLTGTEEGYADYCRIMDAAHDKHRATGERCPAELSPQLMHLEGSRVEVITTYGEKRRFRVGKSTGWMPCHLELARRDSSGGPAAEHEYTSVRVV